MKIHIPKPCHENWSSMTPNEQGRFCGSCQKTVVDFTKLSTLAIQNYFAKNEEQKVCGRFNNEQLSLINIQIPSTLFGYLSAKSKFAVALFIFFGTTLFSCTDNNGNSATIGKIEVVDSLNVQSDTPQLEQAVMLGEPAITNNRKQPLTGEVETIKMDNHGNKIIENKPKDSIVTGPSINETMGKMKVINEPKPVDSITKNERLIIRTLGLVERKD